MELTATTAIQRSRWMLPRALDVRAVSAWVLALALVLYLAVDGGGYSLAAHSQVGIAVWWLVVVAAAWRLLPVARINRVTVVTVGLFAAFTTWTALGITWSISSGRSFQDLALVTCYLGIIVLGVAIHRERNQAVRHTTGAVAAAIVLVAALAVASRIWPHLFPGSQQTGQFLSGAQSRLSWPLNYWNAMATLMAIGVPLLLAQATSARTLKMQALATAAIPLVVLCDVFTLSRGGAIEGVVAVLVFLALAPDRIPKLATTALAGIGSAVLVYGGVHRHAVQQGLINATERHEANSLVIAIVLVCVGTGIAQLGLGLVARHATLPRLLQVSVRQARALTAIGVVVVIVAAIGAGVPHRLDHAWNDFKSPTSSIATTSVSRLGSTAGEGRYQMWTAAVDSAKSHPFTGSGPGTYQLDWLPRATVPIYVQNAHSLYLETYAELGVVGLVLLAAFFVAALTAVGRMVARSRYEDRTRAAAIAGALVAFLIAAAFDWVWQMPVIPAAILLLVAAVLAPARGRASERIAGTDAHLIEPAHSHRSGLITQVVTVVVGLACLVALAYPLATSSAVSNSQAAANSGNWPQALTDAQNAVRLESGSAAAQRQLALVYEHYHSYRRAIDAARHAVAAERQNWENWLVLARLQAESGNARGALVSYEKAKSLNPQSSLLNS